MRFLSWEIPLFRSFKIKPVFFILLLLLTAVSSQLMNSANVKLQEMIMSREGISSEIWIYAGLQIVLTFLTEAIVFMAAVLTLSSFSQSRLFWTHLNQLLIENLRSWGKILLGFICFIVPGLILFLRYLLVPFVVLFDPSYEQGQVDALEQSRNLYSALTLPQWLALLALKLALPIAIALGFEEINEFQDGAFLFLLRQVLEVFSLLLFIWVIKHFLERKFLIQTSA